MPGRHEAQPGRPVSRLVELAAFPCRRNEGRCIRGPIPGTVDNLRIASSLRALASIMALKALTQFRYRQGRSAGRSAVSASSVPDRFSHCRGGAGCRRKATSPDPHDQPSFDTKGPRQIPQPSALTDKPVPDAVKRLPIDLLHSLRFDTPHRRPCDRFGSHCGIDRVGLVRLHIGLHISRRDPGLAGSVRT